MGEHLIELDPEADVLEALACFAAGDKGVVQVAEMRKWLGELGDRMDDREVSPAVVERRQMLGDLDTSLGLTLGNQIERLFSGPFTDRQGRFNYVEFAKVLRVNDGEEEREDKLAL